MVMIIIIVIMIIIIIIIKITTKTGIIAIKTLIHFFLLGKRDKAGLFAPPPLPSG